MGLRQSLPRLPKTRPPAPPLPQHPHPPLRPQPLPRRSANPPPPRRQHRLGLSLETIFAFGNPSQHAADHHALRAARLTRNRTRNPSSVSRSCSFLAPPNRRRAFATLSRTMQVIRSFLA